MESNSRCCPIIDEKSHSQNYCEWILMKWEQSGLGER
ncbi:hypothetical protein F383_04787 [Gossypium arboreum]|uniref:Uncharacterized protein n=1 Tax=Gossypium arboreum TaxID=29729 RepID=A0A0B0PMS4_GOSAR|nr:hypothetical protein F383_04787 [Gossypium arboreum]